MCTNDWTLKPRVASDIAGGGHSTSSKLLNRTIGKTLAANRHDVTRFEQWNTSVRGPFYGPFGSYARSAAEEDEERYQELS